MLVVRPQGVIGHYQYVLATQHWICLGCQAVEPVHCCIRPHCLIHARGPPLHPHHAAAAMPALCAAAHAPWPCCTACAREQNHR
jgi:hypothetical protein